MADDTYIRNLENLLCIVNTVCYGYYSRKSHVEFKFET